MRLPSHKPSLLARFAAPVILSLALHGLFVVGLWQLPARQTVSQADADLTQAPYENECVLRLDDAPRFSQPVAAPQKPHDDRSLTQASFDVHLVDPPLPPALLPRTLGAAPGLTAPGVGAPASSPDHAGDGTGKGSGPCALEVGKSAQSVVYVVDRSISMGFHGALARARLEVLASLRRLAPSTRFQIIAYNREAEPMGVDGRYGLLTADPDTLRKVAASVTALLATGSTDHGRALRRAISFHPDLIYFLTDADDVSLDDVRTVTLLAKRRTVIHTIELIGGGAARTDGPLQRLAADNGGTYRRLDPDE
jgi:von Willebrand factor type A domain